MSGRGRWWAVAGVVVGVIAGGGAALAASGGSTSVIHACFSKRSGALRVAAHCRRGERAISWNKVGLRGPTGAAGRNGANGTKGRDGVNGLPGSARAYAFVNGAVGTPGHAPSFDATRTKGFSAVTEPTPGTYCLTAPGIDPSTTSPAVTAVFNSAVAGEITTAQLDTTENDCPGAFEVKTLASPGTAPVRESEAPNLNFTIVVP